MKIYLVILSVLFFGSACFAADFSAALRVKTGDAQMDLHLNNVNSKASTPTGATQVRTELRDNYSVSEKEIRFLNKQGYTLAEIQYLALLARQSGKPINKVAAVHSKGVGWGVMAKRLGVRPDALRKQIVAEKKIEKAERKEIKMEAREQLKFKQERVQPHRMDNRGMGGGMGGGRGRGR